jgi:hypothetical protein
MIRKRVWRYYCEHCHRGGCSASAMASHERSCTLNPDRVCKMCALAGNAQPEMSSLLSILPDPESFVMETVSSEYGPPTEYSYMSDGGSVDEAMKTLVDVCNGCPACILAALRIKHIPVPLARTFDYSKAVAEFWEEHNAKSLQM